MCIRDSYATVLANDKEKISTKFNDLSEILCEAATWAKLIRSKLITDKFMHKALKERIERVKKYDTHYLEMIKENTLLIDTSGAKVGQINGLTVLTIGAVSYTHLFYHICHVVCSYKRIVYSNDIYCITFL